MYRMLDFIRDLQSWAKEHGDNPPVYIDTGTEITVPCIHFQKDGYEGPEFIISTGAED